MEFLLIEGRKSVNIKDTDNRFDVKERGVEKIDKKTSFEWAII